MGSFSTKNTDVIKKWKHSGLEIVPCVSPVFIGPNKKEYLKKYFKSKKKKRENKTTEKKMKLSWNF